MNIVEVPKIIKCVVEGGRGPKGDDGIDGGGEIQSVANYTALRALASYNQNIVVVKDWSYTGPDGNTYTTLGGIFKKVTTGTENGGTIIVGNYIWERQWDKVHVQPEWFSELTDAKRINNALNALADGGVLSLLGGKQYILDTTITVPTLNVSSNVKIEGNYATLKRANPTHTTLTANAGVGVTSITVASTVGFKVGDLFLISNGLELANKSTNNSQTHVITSIVGNVINFSIPIVNTMTIGDDVFTVNTNSMLVAEPLNDVRLHVENLIFDGNIDNNIYNVDWTVNQCVNISGADRAKVVFANCEFYNHPNEVIIIGTHFEINNCIFKNIGGGCIHGSIAPSSSYNYLNQASYVTNCFFDSIAIYNEENGHNYTTGGVYTQSAGLGNITFSNLRVKNCVGGLFSGLMGSTSDKINIYQSHFENADHIWACGADKIIDGVHIEGNQFINCGVIGNVGSVLEDFISNTDWVISNNTFKNTRISLSQSKNCQIINNIFVNDGTFDFNSKSFVLENTAVINIGGNNNIIMNNTIANTYVPSCNKGIFINNNLLSNNNIISNNKISGVEFGIEQPWRGEPWRSYNIIEYNKIFLIVTSNNANGIVFQGGSRVKDNYIYNPNNNKISFLGYGGASDGVADTYVIGNITEPSTFSVSFYLEFYGNIVKDNITTGGYNFQQGMTTNAKLNNYTKSGNTLTLSP